MCSAESEEFRIFTGYLWNNTSTDIIPYKEEMFIICYAMKCKRMLTIVNEQ